MKLANLLVPLAAVAPAILAASINRGTGNSLQLRMNENEVGDNFCLATAPY